MNVAVVVPPVAGAVIETVTSETNAGEETVTRAGLVVGAAVSVTSTVAVPFAMNGAPVMLSVLTEGLTESTTVMLEAGCIGDEPEVQFAWLAIAVSQSSLVPETRVLVLKAFRRSSRPRVERDGVVADDRSPGDVAGLRAGARLEGAPVSSKTRCASCRQRRR